MMRGKSSVIRTQMADSGTSGGFEVQVADFAALAPEFSSAGATLTDVVQAQGTVLEGLGEFWGHKAHGPEFGGRYQPLVARVLALAGASGTAVAGVGDGLQQMGREYGVTEARITDALRSLR
jgi:hypothetical protein